MKIALCTALLALLAGAFYAAYRGVQLYREVTRPLEPVAGAPALLAQPGKQVTTYSFSVVREVVAAPVPVAAPQRPQRARRPQRP
ncbi:hypothetical protein LJ737_23135 [Hymenobacter sp. 15J16-1T3B]|uniref:hypothetical protein n=1 Tax=Hymenobacter sp. 15J16-1T3B TaxID=2886941 RepID=UPI001D0FF79B|nr:hypothetical protein [Hymenobacter sp. 15J16-1T3B]MCC3160149.1 hypothetical protein [Hymenobacter sp. 15J16-1T3B]